MVFLDRHASGLDADVVLVDDFAESKRVVHHLASYGHSRIALIVDDLAVETSRRRREGYLAAHHELGLPIDEGLEFRECINAEVAEAADLGNSCLDQKPLLLFSRREQKLRWVWLRHSTMEIGQTSLWFPSVTLRRPTFLARQLLCLTMTRGFWRGSQWRDSLFSCVATK